VELGKPIDNRQRGLEQIARAYPIIGTRSFIEIAQIVEAPAYGAAYGNRWFVRFWFDATYNGHPVLFERNQKLGPREDRVSFPMDGDNFRPTLDITESPLLSERVVLQYFRQVTLPPVLKGETRIHRALERMWQRLFRFLDVDIHIERYVTVLPVRKLNAALQKLWPVRN
jgi:hypothetical protein